MHLLINQAHFQCHLVSQLLVQLGYFDDEDVPEDALADCLASCFLRFPTSEEEFGVVGFALGLALAFGFGFAAEDEDEA